MKVITSSFPHKTASMFAFKLFEEVSTRSDLPFFTDSGEGLSFAEFETFKGDLALFGPNRNYIFMPFRRSSNIGNVTEVRDIAQIRDPLDVIISQFFSHGWIHVDRNFDSHTKDLRGKIQSGDLHIFPYALLEIEGKAGFGGGSIIKKMDALSTDSFSFPVKRLVVRYEEFVTNYSTWAGRVTDFISPLVDAPFIKSIDPGHNASLGKGSEFYQSGLDYAQEVGLDKGLGKHVRNATPGDHLRFFTKEQIQFLRRKIKGISELVASYYPEST